MDITLVHILVANALFGLAAITVMVFLNLKMRNIKEELAKQSDTNLEIITSSLTAIDKNINKAVNELKSHSELLGSERASQVNDLSETVKIYNENLQSLLSTSTSRLVDILQLSNQESKEAVNKGVELVKSSIASAFDSLEQKQETLAFKDKQESLSRLEQLTRLVNTLRIDNLVELTNELAKHQELAVETDEFIKHLGDCKVLKIEDKHSGQVTQIYYENGIKKSSDTFSGEFLKYQMFFDESGKAEKGLELDSSGNIIFEYKYDDAGEISSRTEFQYDGNGNQTNKEEKSF